SIIRLNLDGTVPADNPFVGDKNKLDEIFSFGHRNPQGLFYDKKRDILFSVEHGPRGGDEINIIKKGENYGWATVSKGKEYTSFSYVGDYRSKKGMRDAIKVYIPSIAPSSLMVYSGKLIKKWQDDLLIGSLVLTHINKITFLNKNFTKSQEIRLLKNLNQRIRDVTESPQGFICFSTDSGDIYKISPLTPL
ncbi:MAG: PQQ-dependent sugar dehydrogenase, partial [Gammaproteobacteria bacterium]